MMSVKDEELFNAYCAEMPWLIQPFEHSEMNSECIVRIHTTAPCDRQPEFGSWAEDGSESHWVAPNVA